jgi:predicted alpha/beta superfamily hydrolase
MEKRWGILGLVLLGVFIHGAAHSEVAAPEPVLVGNKYALDSKVMQERRSYLVHLPPSYATTNTRYPVLILLDGDAHFTHTSGTVDYLAQNLRIPNLIVVAIPNTDRGRDMTPPLPPTATRTTSEGSPDGAKNFLSFIADELLPHLDATYRTQQYRVLVGHSYGALFATYALVTRPEVFDAYLSISPSLWWDDQSLVKSTQEFLKQHHDLRADLYVTLGNEGSRMLGPYWKFAAALGEAQPPNLRWQIHRWTDETHGSVPLRSTHEGLQAIFDGYYIHEPLATYDRIGLTGIVKQYQDVSTRLGYDVPVPDAVLSALLFELRNAKRTEEFEPIALKRLELYPNSADALVTLGRIYAARGDNTRSIDYFSKGLKLFPGNAEARTALTKANIDPKSIVPETTVTPKTLRSYVGRYQGDDQEATVTLESDKLYIAGQAGKCELRASTDTQFYCVGADVELTFKRNGSGRVSSVVVQQPTTSYERKRI